MEKHVRHPQVKSALTVNVDGFKMSGPSANLSKGWELIRKRTKTDDPKAVNKCPGYNPVVIATKANGAMVPGCAI